MPSHVEADVEVTRFAFESDEKGRRLVFPQAEAKRLEGRAGNSSYGATDCAFEGLEGRLGAMRWKTDAASAGSAYLRDESGRFAMAAERAEFPHGLMLVGADEGIELVSPHVSFSELRFTLRGPFGGKPAEESPEQLRESQVLRQQALRQERLRFLDSLSGRIYLTVKVKLDLPVLGVRSLDQQLKVPIQEGSLDFHALEKSLDWLEGRFLDIKQSEDQLKVQWKVPIFGQSHDLITWPLDAEASTLAAFGRVPVRSLTDYVMASGAPPKEGEKKRKVLQAFSVEAIDIALSLLAPRNLDVGAGTILFGGDDQPGMVDLKVTGAIHDRGEGALRGAIGSVDTTIKDLRIGPMDLTADRLHFDGLDQLEVSFEGFRPVAVTMIVHRVTATNLSLKIGGGR
jgi:hypothetical protein